MGYGIDDSRLGGSIARDNTVVFRTEVESSHYWKVEAKDVYTGKGWVHSDDKRRISFAQDSNVPITSFLREIQLKKQLKQAKYIK